MIVLILNGYETFITFTDKVLLLTCYACKDILHHDEVSVKGNNGLARRVQGGPQQMHGTC